MHKARVYSRTFSNGEDLRAPGELGGDMHHPISNHVRFIPDQLALAAIYGQVDSQTHVCISSGLEWLRSHPDATDAFGRLMKVDCITGIHVEATDLEILGIAPKYYPELFEDNSSNPAYGAV